MCLVFAGIVIILYTTLGGMIADQISDLVQFIIILVGLAIATPIVLKNAGGWQAISAKLPGEKLNFTSPPPSSSRAPAAGRPSPPSSPVRS